MRHVLISIREEPWNQILTGYKRYEYRRRFVKEPCIAFAYVGGTMRGIAGYIQLGKAIVGSPEEIAGIARMEHEDWYSGTIDYLEGRTEGFAIPIEKYVAGQHISLDKLREQFGFTAPQLYIDLDKHIKLFEYLANAYAYEDFLESRQGTLF